MAKEDKYRLAKSLIESGSIKNIRDLLAIVDKTPLAKDIPTSAIRFNNLLADPPQFTFHDAVRMAEIIGVDPKLMIDMVYAELLSKKKKRK